MAECQPADEAADLAVTPVSEQAMATLRRKARGHPGASSGELAAWDIYQHFRKGSSVDFLEAFVRLDGEGRRTVVLLLADVASGTTGFTDLR